MKFLVVLALAAVAAAEPEADPYYGVYGAVPSVYGHTGYTAGVYNPLTTTYAAGIHHPYSYTAGLTYPYSYTAGLTYPYVTKVVKREAEAEAEPLHHFGYAGVLPYHAGVYSPYTVATPHVYSHPYTTYAHPYAVNPIKNLAVQKTPGAPVGYKAINAGVAHIVNKREAEAESKPFYSLYNNAYAYNPYHYTAGVVPATTYANTYAGAYHVPAYSGYSAYSYPYIY